jgi:hypothetical protein
MTSRGACVDPASLVKITGMPLRNLWQGQSQSAVHRSWKVVKIMVRGHLNQHQKRQELGQSGQLQ